MKIYRLLVAHLYDRVMRQVEQSGLGHWRAHLLAPLHGTVVEIGAGTGANLAYYPRRIERLLLCEPDRAMRTQLAIRLREQPISHARMTDWGAERMPIEDQSVDFVVATLVFCSLADPSRALQEIERILKPGGSLVVMEHVAAEGQPNLHFWQKFWQPVWRRVAANCHLARETAALFSQKGFVNELKHEVMPGVPAIFSPMIVGRAVKPCGPEL